MSLPAVSGAAAAKAFRKIGYEVDRQGGSHIILRHPEAPHGRLVVPLHKELAKGTLRSLMPSPCPTEQPGDLSKDHALPQGVL
jgi:predicted RNA binding protein YcfA (HicA-like mRNA interferase family)